MYTTIALPIDADDDVTADGFAPAQRLARSLHAKVVLIGERVTIQRHHDAMTYDGVAVSHRYLARDEGLADGVAAVVARRGIEETLVIAATHARSRLGYAAAGSTAEDIVRASRAAVLLIGPDSDADWTPGAGPAVVCLDGTALSEQAVSLARDWAHAHLDEVHVLRVGNATPQPRAAARSVGSYGTDPTIGAVMIAEPVPPPSSEFADPAQTYADGHAMLLRNDGVEAIGIQRAGRRPASAIANHLRANDADVVVMTTHARSGVGRVVLGSTTMAVARHAPCPVLVRTPAVDRSDEIPA